MLYPRIFTAPYSPWPALVLIIGLGCGTGERKVNAGALGGVNSGAACPDASALTYDSFGRAFLGAYCVTCHATALEGAARRGAPSDHNFDTLELVRSPENLVHSDQTAAAGPDAVNMSMPPRAPLPSLAERKKFGEWLACGAP